MRDSFTRATDQPGQHNKALYYYELNDLVAPHAFAYSFTDPLHVWHVCDLRPTECFELHHPIYCANTSVYLVLRSVNLVISIVPRALFVLLISKWMVHSACQLTVRPPMCVRARIGVRSHLNIF